METKEKQFKPKAHILVLLGEELIKSPVMAIYELIKNGYDADAKIVNVHFEKVENKDQAKIIVSDNGTGITEEVLENVWFEPGTDFRKPIIEDGSRGIRRSPIYNRIPMGEKGVGRFAVHKLGHQITLITRPSKVVIDDDGKITCNELLNYELTVTIDWRVFLQSKYLDDVKINWTKNSDINSFKFKDGSGTYIEIRDLKEVWTRGMARQLKRNTLSMLSPKNDISKFDINLDFNNSWLSDFPKTEEILKHAPYKLTVLVDENYDMTFEYHFSLPNKIEVASRSIFEKSENEIDRAKNERNIKGELIPFYRNYLEVKEFEEDVIDLAIDEFDSEINKMPFGSLMVELYSFDLDALSLKDYTSSPDLLKSFVKDQAGIQVFKGYLRVYDYGDPGNDWLGLDIKRVNNKTWFSNNQNIGYIYLDDRTSSSLVEKTNREGFIENTAFEHFKMLLEFILNEFRAERQSDRERWLLFNKTGPDSSFESQLNDFKSIITNTNLNEEDKRKKLLSAADKIQSRYEDDKNTLIIPASVGMTASFAMHEIEKLVPRMKESINQNPINKYRVSDQVDELKDYVDGILSIIKKGGNKPVSAVEAINQAFNNYASRIKHRRISFHISNESTVDTIVCDKRLLITMLMNIIDNSIYWLDTVHKDFKGIYVAVQKNEKGVAILIVDNGPGFKDRIEDIVRPFFTRKDGGIGIGMYLVDTVMIQYGKLNIIYDKEELLSRGVPKEYSGAGVELVFNKLS